MSDLPKLLDLLNRDPHERLSISTKTNGQFRSKIVSVEEAADLVDQLRTGGWDGWYGTAAIHERVTRGRGEAKDVIGVRELYADLDVKPGGMPSIDAALKVVRDLSLLLGAAPAMIVKSGHGLQPHWPLERGDDTDWPDETDPRHQRATVLFRRWHRLVLHVAERWGGSVDNVSDLSRVLRIPGTVNNKYPQHPVPVEVVEIHEGGAVSLHQLADCLDAYSIPAQSGDDEILGDVIVEPSQWQFGAATCSYVKEMIAGWANDQPGSAGRHPWLVSQAIRIASAHRAGCITHADHQQAVKALSKRFRELLTTGKRQEGRGEILDAVAWGQAKVSRFPTTDRVLKELGSHEHPPEPTTLDPGLEERFWESRPELSHIRTFARARRASPWAVLATVLVRATVAVPPHYVLPAIIGGHASLNLFLGIVANSGGGKGAAEAAAGDVVDVGSIRRAGVGSGEGILHQYVQYQPPNKKTGDPGGVVQHNCAVLFTAPEVDTLNALHQRQSSTLLSELRKVYMGEELSFAYVDPTKRLHVAQHKYRAGLIVGIQPARAGVLLDDTDGGTPQRFVWMPGTDADMPDTPPKEPDPITWKFPVKHNPSGTGRVTVEVCDTARSSIDREHVKRNRGDGDALDGHALLTRLKWAAALGLLDGRVEVSEQDWELAGTIMAMSDHTRGQVIQTLRLKSQQANQARGKARAEQQLIVDEIVDDGAVKRVARRIVDKLAGGQWVPRHKLRNGTIAARDRGYFDAAIERLVEAGQIEVDAEGTRTHYRLAGGRR